MHHHTRNLGGQKAGPGGDSDCAAAMSLLVAPGKLWMKRADVSGGFTVQAAGETNELLSQPSHEYEFPAAA